MRRRRQPRTVAKALAEFGAPAALVTAAATLGDKEVLFFGVAPSRVDILRDISAVEFEEGGFKASGSGRLGGLASIEEFLEYKQITQDFIPHAH